MTTRQLAAWVANAARTAPDPETATIAVLRALRAADAWFCHWVEDGDGFTYTGPFAPDPAHPETARRELALEHRWEENTGR